MRLADHEEHTHTHEPFKQKKTKKGIFACTQLSNFPEIVEVVMVLISNKRFVRYRPVLFHSVSTTSFNKGKIF